MAVPASTVRAPGHVLRRCWSPSAAAGRIAAARAVRELSRAVPEVTEPELRIAGDGVAAGVREMPDLLRAGFTVAVLLSLLVPDRRLPGVRETERFGRGVALAAVWESRAGGPR